MRSVTGVQGKEPNYFRFSISLVLQQSSALFPFMRKFISLLLIACRASTNDVRDIIAPFSRKRDNMISVPYKIFLGILLLAIIAPMMLALNLFLELFSGKRTGGISFASASLMCLRYMQFSVLICMIVSKMAFFFIFEMVLSILCSFSIFLVFMSLMILYPFTSFFLLMLIIVTSSACVFTYPTCILKAIRAFFRIAKARSRENLLAFRASLISIRSRIRERILSPSSAITRPTRRMKIESPFIFWIKIFRKSRKGLFAFRALLCRGIFGYSVIHGRTTFLSSRSRVLQAPLGQNIYTPLYHASTSEASLFPFSVFGGY